MVVTVEMDVMEEMGDQAGMVSYYNTNSYYIKKQKMFKFTNNNIPFGCQSIFPS